MRGPGKWLGYAKRPAQTTGRGMNVRASAGRGDRGVGGEATPLRAAPGCSRRVRAAEVRRVIGPDHNPPARRGSIEGNWGCLRARAFAPALPMARPWSLGPVGETLWLGACRRN